MDNFREWLSDHLRYILLGLAVALVVIILVCILRLAGGSKKKSRPAASTTTQTTAQEAAQEDSSEAEKSGLALSAGSSLQKDQEEILTLVKKYYTAVAAKDTATLATIVEPWNDQVQSGILSSTVIERYDNISTYSKEGPTTGTYVVYTYYDGKIKDINTEAPSLALLYVVTKDGGSLAVGDRNASTEVADFISQATAAGDVQALKNDVNQKLLDAENADPDLKAFIDSQSGSQAASGEQSTEADSSSQTGESGGKATTTAGVNIRSKAGTDGSIVAVTYAGAEVDVIERGAEWSHINFTYDGKVYDGYISNQYLDFGETKADSYAGEDQGAGSGDQASEPSGAASGSAATGTGEAV